MGSRNSELRCILIMKRNGFHRKFLITFSCFSVLCCPSAFTETRAQSATKQAMSSQMALPRQVRQIVNRISRIEELPVKKGEPVNDRYAKSIVELGEAAAPYLIEKLTSQKDSRVVYLYQYKIGDVARSLLSVIYGYPDYPFPDNSQTLPAKYGDYRDYTEFFSSSQNRCQLQKSWRNFVKNRTADKQTGQFKTAVSTVELTTRNED